MLIKMDNATERLELLTDILAATFYQHKKQFELSAKVRCKRTSMCLLTI